jgi:hypothetical protein
MQFISSRPDVVRSINQRWLLNYWNKLRVGTTLPKWQAIEIEELAGILESLSFQDVVGPDEDSRFRVRFHGKRIADLYGRADCIGKFLDEILPPTYTTAAHSTYRQAVASKMPVYTVSDMRDRLGRIVHYERLLLPFATDGEQVVNRIVASLEAVSPEGAFEARALMQSPPQGASFAVCTTIQF